MVEPMQDTKESQGVNQGAMVRRQKQEDQPTNYGTQ